MLEKPKSQSIFFFKSKTFCAFQIISGKETLAIFSSLSCVELVENTCE